MASLHIHDDAAADLEELWELASQAASRIVILLQELEGDQELLDRLTEQNYGAYGSADFHITKWLEHWNAGKDLWRLKIWELEDKGFKYRIVYAFVPGKLQYHVLAIAPREFNYETDHPLTRRILAAHEDL